MMREKFEKNTEEELSVSTEMQVNSQYMVMM